VSVKPLPDILESRPLARPLNRALILAALGLKVPRIRIKNAGCVTRTFPSSFEKLEQLRQ